ncbi:6653_t:CDS:2, partial [Funneliformis mosseae]
MDRCEQKFPYDSSVALLEVLDPVLNKAFAFIDPHGLSGGSFLSAGLKVRKGDCK